MTRLSLVLPLALLLCAGVAKADSITLSYELIGPGITATFQMPVHPTILDGNFDIGFGFVIRPLNLKINGLDSNDFLVFYSLSGKGGFGAFASFWTRPELALKGTQLYSGSEKNPIMLEFLNPETLLDFEIGDDTYTLTVVPTPEPATLILLGFGLLFVAFIAKSQRAYPSR